MSTASKPPASRKRTFVASTYDKAAGWLLSALIFAAVLLFCVFIIWLTNQTFSTAKSRPIYPREEGGGDPEGTDERGLDLNMPLADQIAQETDLDEERLEESLSMVEDVLATRASVLTDPVMAQEDAGGQTGGSTGTGNDQRKGFGPGRGGGVRREDRWVILYDQTNLNTYARQLDFFKIELGAIGRGEVYFVSNLAAASPTVRKAGTDVQDDRLRFSWTSGTLQQYDRSLLQKGGISPSGMFIVHFYSAELENELAHLEFTYKNVEGKDIRRTRFAVRANGDGGFEY